MFWQALFLSGLAAAQNLPQPSAEDVQPLGIQKSVNANIGRDLGWTGKVGDTILATYGDTHTCGLTPGKFVGEDGCSVPSASNSVARVDAKDPTKVFEFPEFLNGGSGTAKQFCAAYADEPDDAGQFAIGITQIQPVSDTESMLFFLINNRTDPNNLILEGAGVAKVTMEDGVPKCDRVKNALSKGRTANYFWDGQNEPNYGAYASMSGNDGYIYGYGEMADDPHPAWASVYANRVPKEKFDDINAYEYWNGQAWQTQRLRNPSDKAAVMQKYAQSSAHYSKFYDAYLMMGMNGLFDGLSARLAKKPEGPWTKPTTSLWKDGTCAASACSYGGAMMPWYDPSGRTTAVSYTPVASSTVLKVLNVTWAGPS